MVVLRDAGQVHEIALQQLDLAHEARRLHDAVGGGQHVGGDVYRHHRSSPPSPLVSYIADLPSIPHALEQVQKSNKEDGLNTEQ